MNAGPTMAVNIEGYEARRNRICSGPSLVRAARIP